MNRYTVETVTTLCSVCREPIAETSLMADHYIYEADGTIDYIELAHETCGMDDNEKRGGMYWDWG